ncbi:MAG: hypothetical protein FE78DRAFT_126629, partial [Acidomyces sp. 'richmondensis']
GGGPDVQRSRSPDVWAGAISRLQTQVSYNTSMLESMRRQVAELEQRVNRLPSELASLIPVNDVRYDQRPRINAEDLEVLESQIAHATNKANEIDGLRMQLDLVKNRLRRFEEHAS